MQIKAIIVDDEKHCRENLSYMLEQHCPGVQVLALCSSAMDAKLEIERLNPDVVFLDIEMPGANGFNLLKQIDVSNLHIIFVTAFDQYALKAIKYNALDYILKPIDPRELNAAIVKLTDKLFTSQTTQRLTALKDSLQSGNLKRLALPVLNETHFIEPKTILYIKGESNYSHFYFDEGKSILVSKSLSEYESLLKDEGFIRCHKGFLINTDKVEKMLNTDGGILVMKNNVQIPIARRRKVAVFHQLSTTPKRKFL